MAIAFVLKPMCILPRSTGLVRPIGRDFDAKNLKFCSRFLSDSFYSQSDYDCTSIPVIKHCIKKVIPKGIF